MRNKLKNLYQNTFLKYPLQPLKWFYDIYRFRLIPEKHYIKRQYKRVFGLYPNLEHPKTFNEKIQWLKLNDRTPLHTICSDKYKMREYVKEKIGQEYLVPLVFETKNVKDICGENIPNYPVIIKTNHDSSGGVIIRDKNNQDWKKLQKYYRKLLKRNYYYGVKEWQYKNIEKRIIVEQLLVGEDGGIPFDYKVHCFNGVPKFIQVDIDRMTEHKRNLYTPQWKKMEVSWEYPMGKDVKEPLHLKKMLLLATKLSKYFINARIDFYAIRNSLYIGEITFHSESGTGAFSPNEWDLKLGNKLKLPVDEKKKK